MQDRNKHLPRWLRGLSARLLVLTMVFVMLSEVLIYVPSLARFRLMFLEIRHGLIGFGPSGNVEDPTVRHVASRLMQSIGRAIELCSQILSFGRADEATPD
jgi:hypothetical protein